jgi:hypothetical protein
MEELEPCIFVMPFSCAPGFPAHNKGLRKVTLASPYLSPPNPSFSGIRKVRKFY